MKGEHCEQGNADATARGRFGLVFAYQPWVIGLMGAQTDSRFPALFSGRPIVSGSRTRFPFSRPAWAGFGSISPDLRAKSPFV
jgi:hypothetical protein